MSGGSRADGQRWGQCRGDDAVKFQVLVSTSWRHSQLGSFCWLNEAIVNYVVV